MFVTPDTGSYSQAAEVRRADDGSAAAVAEAAATPTELQMSTPALPAAATGADTALPHAGMLAAEQAGSPAEAAAEAAADAANATHVQIPMPAALQSGGGSSSSTRSQAEEQTVAAAATSWGAAASEAVLAAAMAAAMTAAAVSAHASPGCVPEPTAAGAGPDTTAAAQDSWAEMPSTDVDAAQPLDNGSEQHATGGSEDSCVVVPLALQQQQAQQNASKEAEEASQAAAVDVAAVAAAAADPGIVSAATGADKAEKLCSLHAVEEVKQAESDAPTLVAAAATAPAAAHDQLTPAPAPAVAATADEVTAFIETSAEAEATAAEPTAACAVPGDGLMSHPLGSLASLMFSEYSCSSLASGLSAATLGLRGEDSSFTAAVGGGGAACVVSVSGGGGMGSRGGVLPPLLHGNRHRLSSTSIGSLGQQQAWVVREPSQPSLQGSWQQLQQHHQGQQHGQKQGQQGHVLRSEPTERIEEDGPAEPPTEAQQEGNSNDEKQAAGSSTSPSPAPSTTPPAVAAGPAAAASTTSGRPCDSLAIVLSGRAGSNGEWLLSTEGSCSRRELSCMAQEYSSISTSKSCWGSRGSTAAGGTTAGAVISPCAAAVGACSPASTGVSGPAAEAVAEAEVAAVGTFRTQLLPLQVPGVVEGMSCPEGGAGHDNMQDGEEATAWAPSPVMCEDERTVLAPRLGLGSSSNSGMVLSIPSPTAELRCLDSIPAFAGGSSSGNIGSMPRQLLSCPAGPASQFYKLSAAAGGVPSGLQQLHTGPLSGLSGSRFSSSSNSNPANCHGGSSGRPGALSTIPAGVEAVTPGGSAAAGAVADGLTGILALVKQLQGNLAGLESDMQQLHGALHRRSSTAEPGMLSGATARRYQQ